MQLKITLLQVEFSPTPFKNTTKLRSFVMRKNVALTINLLFCIFIVTLNSTL